jgi:hypothetical protein
MATKKKTPGEAWNAMREADLDDLVDEIDAMSPDEVDRALDAAGGDAAGTAKRALAQIAALKERHARLAWQDEARAKLEAGRAAFAAVRARRPKLTREELLARIDAAQKDARFATPIVTFFRKRTSAETTDEELEALLDEIETARELEGRGGGDPDPGASR